MTYINIRNKIIAQGTSYITDNLVQDIDSNFSQAKNVTGSVYEFQFSSTNLVAGVLTITHALDTSYPRPLIRRPDGTYEDAISIMTYISSNQVSFDFGGTIETGTWIGQITK